MRLTVYTDYALRVLMYLGLKSDELSTIEEVAEAYGISRTHLMKVVHRLGRAGYIETVRGRNGGLRLGPRPEDINIGGVVRHAEEDLALVECFPGGQGRCVISPACALKPVLGEAMDAFFAVLDGYTLADLLKPGPKLGRRLGLPARTAA